MYSQIRSLSCSMYRIISSTPNYVLVTTALIAAKFIKNKNGPAGEFDLAIQKARVFKTLVYAFHHSGIKRTLITYSNLGYLSRDFHRNLSKQSNLFYVLSCDNYDIKVRIFLFLLLYLSNLHQTSYQTNQKIFH